MDWNSLIHGIDWTKLLEQIRFLLPIFTVITTLIGVTTAAIALFKWLRSLPKKRVIFYETSTQSLPEFDPEIRKHLTLIWDNAKIRSLTAVKAEIRNHRSEYAEDGEIVVTLASPGSEILFAEARPSFAQKNLVTTSTTTSFTISFKRLNTFQKSSPKIDVEFFISGNPDWTVSGEGNDWLLFISKKASRKTIAFLQSAILFLVYAGGASLLGSPIAQAFITQTWPPASTLSVILGLVVMLICTFFLFRVRVPDEQILLAGKKSPRRTRPAKGSNASIEVVAPLLAENSAGDSPIKSHRSGSRVAVENGPAKNDKSSGSKGKKTRSRPRR